MTAGFDVGLVRDELWLEATHAEVQAELDRLCEQFLSQLPAPSPRGPAMSGGDENVEQTVPLIGADGSMSLAGDRRTAPAGDLLDPSETGVSMDELEMWCDRCQRHHQPRERKVPCRSCRTLTAEPHAECVGCQAKRVA